MSHRHHKDNCCESCCNEPCHKDSCCNESCYNPTPIYGNFGNLGRGFGFGSGAGSGSWIWIIIVIAIFFCLSNKDKCRY
jgi:hypothetical protein